MEDFTKEELEKIEELNNYVKVLLEKYKTKTLNLDEAEFLQAHIEYLLELENENESI